MSSFIHWLVIPLLTCCAAPLGAQKFIDLPGCRWCTDVSPDGRIVAGIWNRTDCFIWKRQEGPVPFIFSGAQLEAISDDGTVAAGTIKDPVKLRDEAAIRTESTGRQSIGFPPDAAGSFSASTTWPAGVPSGTGVWFQFIVRDASSTHGLTLSNGLKATTP